MVPTTLSPEAILTSLTRVVHPHFGIDVVNLGTIYGTELNASTVTITMTLTSAFVENRPRSEQLITEGLQRRHPELSRGQFEISFDPPCRDDFITPEGQLQLNNPLPSQPSKHVAAGYVMDSLMFVNDPEGGVNVVDLGLIHNVELNGSTVVITMTLTTPGCPLHDTIEEAICRVIETRHLTITDIHTDLMWDSPWETNMISDAGRKALDW